MALDQAEFIAFLLDAKRATYASASGEAVVESVLPGAHQLEYHAGPFFYRDIYYGGERFIGQETVYHDNRPLWSMCYAGWSLDARIPIGDFLKEALRQAPASAPYRGPAQVQRGAYRYTNEIHGEIAQFWGHEIIAHEGVAIYELRYQGGMILP